MAWRYSSRSSLRYRMERPSRTNRGPFLRSRQARRVAGESPSRLAASPSLTTNGVTCIGLVLDGRVRHSVAAFVRGSGVEAHAGSLASLILILHHGVRNHDVASVARLLHRVEHGPNGIGNRSTVDVTTPCPPHGGRCVKACSGHADYQYVGVPVTRPTPFQGIRPAHRSSGRLSQ